MSAIWAIGANPRRKRRSKRRAARKMTAKQLKYFGGGKRKSRRGGKRRARRHSAGAPVMHRRSRRRSGSKRVGRSFSTHNAMNLLKTGAIGGAGAVLVDIGMGQLAPMLASSLPSMSTPVDATTGGPNYGYYGLKAALAVALGTWGGKVIPGGMAERMSEGALTVLAYQFIRPMVPASLTLGYVNPAPTMRRVGGMAPGAVVGKYLPVGAYTGIPVRGNNGAGAGARAAQVVNLRNR